MGNNNSNSVAVVVDAKSVKDEEKEGFDRKEGELIVKEKIRLDTELKEIEASLLNDKSHTNQVNQFAKVLKLQGKSMGTAKDVITNIKNGWTKVSNSLDKVKSCFTRDEFSNLKKIRYEYFCLLLETSKVVKHLDTQCKLQHQHIASLMKLSKKQKESRSISLDVYDKVIYKDSTDGLTKWLDQTRLEKLTKEWDKIIIKLQDQQLICDEKIEILEKQNKRYKTMKNVGKGIAVLAGLGGLVCVIVASCGVAAAPVAIGAAAAFAAEGSLFAIGAGLFGVGLVCSAMNTSTIAMLAEEGKLLRKMNEINDRLKEMMEDGKKIRAALSTLEGEKDNVELYLQQFKEENIGEMMPGLKLMEENLENYQKECKAIIEIVKKEIVQMITKF